MSRWADWFMISIEQADYFADVALVEGDEAVSALLAPLLNAQASDAQMDKAWEPIHRCLTGDQTPALNFDAGEYPLKLCVLGGEQLLTKGYRSLALVHGYEVPDVAAALATIDVAWMSERFFTLPDNQFHEIDDVSFNWMWSNFRQLPPLFARAAEKEYAILCTISH